MGRSRYIQGLAWRRAGRVWTSCLYFRAIVREFRWSIVALLAAMAFGTLLYWLTPQHELGGERPNLLTAIYCAWMAMLAQPQVAPPMPWHITVVNIIYPILGFMLVGEGVVRFAFLMLSRRHGEKEWTRVMASTYRNHIVLCGLGHLGYRVLEQLAASGAAVVAIEKREDGRFVPLAKGLGVPVLIRDVHEDQALIDAGIEHARTVIVATDDDMANIEVALDARRMNPDIHVVLRLFDQQIAAKIKGALLVNAAFSASALAAPLVAALSLESKVLSSVVIAGVPHVTTELTIAPGSPLCGRNIGEAELAHAMRVLAHTPRGQEARTFPPAGGIIGEGDTVVVHCRASDLTALSAAGCAAGVA